MNGVTIGAFQGIQFEKLTGRFQASGMIDLPAALKSPVKLSKFEPFFDNRR